MPLVEFLIVIAFILLGIRIGGLGIGAAAVMGVAVLVFGFGAPVASPPLDVVFIILAIVTTSSTLEAVGGLALLVEFAERILRRRPRAITFVAPLVAYTLTLLAGTGYVAYALLPVIAEVAISARVRPERPLSIAVIASQLAITASPVSAATAAMLGMLAWHRSALGLLDVLGVCIPSTLAGSMLGALAVCRRGKDLAEPDMLAPAGGYSTAPTLSGRSLVPRPSLNSPARASLAIFLTAVVCIVFLGLFPDLRPMLPHGNALERLDMASAIQMLMLSATGIIIVVCRCKVDTIPETPIMRAGVAATLAILGITWLGNCFFEANRPFILSKLSGAIASEPWLFSVALFGLSALISSQSATVGALMNVGFAMNFAHPLLIAMFPAVNGFFFFPTAGPVVAAAVFDRTGSTRIGTRVLDHSFMLPGLVGTAGSVLIAIVLTKLLY
jgi:anaerobic C4-dicarboxylate transporter DcuA